LLLVIQHTFYLEGNLSDEFWKAYTASPEIEKTLLRKSIETKKISLIIPCHYKHANQLYALLRIYENQTRLPDEVVISLSNANEVNQCEFHRLEQEKWAFPITLLISDKRKYAGENRNIACSHASGDIFICQDADDVPYPQRIEVIGYFFEKYKIDHLMHEFRFISVNAGRIFFPNYSNLDQIRFSNTINFQAIYQYEYFTNGNPAITKDLFQSIKWPNTPRGQDTAYNQSIYAQGYTCIAIGAVLYGYRQYLSSSLTPAMDSENSRYKRAFYEFEKAKIKKHHTLRVLHLSDD
jgi:hypothetical protein